MIEFQLEKEILKQSLSKHDITELATTFFKSHVADKTPIESLISFSAYVLPDTDKKGISKYFGPRKMGTLKKKFVSILSY